LVQQYGWRAAGITVALAALAVVPLVLWLMRDHPADVGLTAYGAPVGTPVEKPAPVPGAAGRALRVLRDSSKTTTFWLLVGGFASCGASTNGLIATHFIPAAHAHGLPETTAANLLALVGLFDIVGTIASGWLTDRIDSRALLGAYYALRGLSLLVLP